MDGEKVFPESMTSAADGSVFFGSIGNKMIYRGGAGFGQGRAIRTARHRLGTEHLRRVRRQQDQYAVGLLEPAGPPGGPPATLYAFDLKTGASKGHYPFVTAGALCNDVATGPTAPPMPPTPTTWRWKC